MRIYTQQLASHISACTGAVCAFVYYVKSKKRSNCCGRLQLGDATIRTTLYLDRHGNQNAADGGIISLCSLALHTTSSASTCYAFRCSQCGASTPHKSNAHTCTHVCNAMCQCVRPQTHTPLVFVADLASPQDEEIPFSDGVQSNASIHFNNAPLSQRFGERGRERCSTEGGRNVKYQTNRKQTGDVTDEIFHPIFASLWGK